MRFTNWFLGIAGVGAIAMAGLAGCGSSSGGATGSGASGAGGSGSPSSTTNATTGSPTSSGTSMGGPCSPHSSCPSPKAAIGCIGLTDNTGLTKFGLRMSELDVSKPTKLAAGIVASTISTAVEQNEMACNLSGSATFNWLLQFDTTAGTLTTGGAKPVADPTQGYSFDMDTVMGFSLAPITIMTKPDATGKFGTMTGQDLIVPIFLDAMGMNVVLLPLKQARITMGTLSDGNNCIGSYNAATLDPTNSCAPDATHKQYTDAGSLDGYITLKDANSVLISALNESLCALLAGGAGSPDTTTAMGSSELVCKTDANGNPTFMGDWCAATNSAGGCMDSVSLAATFAASSVIIN